MPVISSFKLWSRVRKYGASPTGITQNVETLLLDPNGRRIIANSEFMILLKQAKMIEKNWFNS